MALDHRLYSLSGSRVFLLRIALMVLVAGGHWNSPAGQTGLPDPSNTGPEYAQLALLPQVQIPVSGKQLVEVQPISMMVPACALRDPEALGKITIGIAAWGVDTPVTTRLIAAQSASSGL